MYTLKGQCHEIFDDFFCLKDYTWVPYEQAKTVSRTFSLSQRYLIAHFENRVSAWTRKFFFRYKQMFSYF